MDYNGLREGVTVYLPVFQEGAYCLLAMDTRWKAMAN